VTSFAAITTTMWRCDGRRARVPSCGVHRPCSGRAAAGGQQQLPLDSSSTCASSSAAKYAQTTARRRPPSPSSRRRTSGATGTGPSRTCCAGCRLLYVIRRDYTYLASGIRPADGLQRPGPAARGRPYDERERVRGASLGTELVLDPAVIERVEVVQGPGSALYGTGAMFASINIVTRKGAALAGPTRPSKGVAGAAAGVAVGRRLIGTSLDVTVAGQWTQVDGADQYYGVRLPGDQPRVAHNLDWTGTARRSLVCRGRDSAPPALAASRTKGSPPAPSTSRSTIRGPGRSRSSVSRGALRGAPSAAAQLQLRGYASQNGYEGGCPTPSWRRTPPRTTCSVGKRACAGHGAAQPSPVGVE